MEQRSGKAKTVKVVMHLSADGESWAAGVIVSEWNGSVRVDRREARAHPMPVVTSTPRGVSEPVWRAYCALTEIVRTQVEGAADTPG